MTGHPLAIPTSRSRTDQPRAVPSCGRHAGNHANRYHGLGEVESGAAPLRCPFRLEGHHSGEAGGMSAVQPLSGGKRTHCGHVASAVPGPDIGAGAAPSPGITQGEPAARPASRPRSPAPLDSAAAGDDALWCARARAYPELPRASAGRPRAHHCASRENTTVSSPWPPLHTDPRAASTIPFEVAHRPK
jgi:hypothetical protein